MLSQWSSLFAGDEPNLSCAVLVIDMRESILLCNSGGRSAETEN